jgi:hypothetical protein
MCERLELALTPTPAIPFGCSHLPGSEEMRFLVANMQETERWPVGHREGFNRNEQIFCLGLAFLVASASFGFVPFDKPNRQATNVRCRVAAKQRLGIECDLESGRKEAG